MKVRNLVTQWWFLGLFGLGVAILVFALLGSSISALLGLSSTPPAPSSGGFSWLSVLAVLIAIVFLALWMFAGRLKINNAWILAVIAIVVLIAALVGVQDFVQVSRDSARETLGLSTGSDSRPVDRATGLPIYGNELIEVRHGEPVVGVLNGPLTFRVPRRHCPWMSAEAPDVVITQPRSRSTATLTPSSSYRDPVVIELLARGERRGNFTCGPG